MCPAGWGSLNFAIFLQVLESIHDIKELCFGAGIVFLGAQSTHINQVVVQNPKGAAVDIGADDCLFSLGESRSAVFLVRYRFGGRCRPGGKNHKDRTDQDGNDHRSMKRLIAPSVLVEAQRLMERETLEVLVAQAGLWGPFLIIGLMTVLSHKQSGRGVGDPVLS